MDRMAYDFELGPWSRTISTRSQSAQDWFDRGLTWTYAYNHEEAVVCFRRALAADPACAMAWWGIAYASGPFYNRPWIRFSDAEVGEALPVCHAAACAALAGIDTCTPAERGLIEAIALRYQNDKEADRSVLNRWHGAYTDAMRRAHTAHPGDLDIAALFAEAAVTCTPRQLWNLKTGEMNPQALTHEALAVLERSLADGARAGVLHPGLMHMLIHALEMSPFPERALAAADALRGYAPDAGHLEHMPAHIYVLCGDYAQAVAQSERAVRADDKYLARAGASNFYTTACCHDLHLYMYAAMFLGQFKTALAAADRIGALATSDLIAASAPFMASILDGYSAMRVHVLVRFGRWQELIDMPPPPDARLRPIGVAMHAYGRGVACAAYGRIAEAEAAQARFRLAQEAIAPDAIFLSNPIRTMLLIGDAMLEGELQYRKGNFDAAFVSLRLAVARDDALNYTEPWAWMHPPRHALAALLAEQGHFEEAESVLRTDLGFDAGLARCCQHPDNVWALRGLVECVERSGSAGELQVLRQRLQIAQARADVPVESACCCRRPRALSG